MGQSLLLAGLLGVLAAGAPGQEPSPSPSPSPVETASEVLRCDGDLLDCWLEAEAGATVSVVISEPLGAAPQDLTERLEGAAGGEERARLVVTVTSEEGTGSLGAVLFALAGEGDRFVDPGALIDPLGEQDRAALDDADDGVCGAECRDAAERLDGGEPLLAEELIAAGLAQEAAGGLVALPDEGDGGGTSPLVVALAAVLGALLAALVAFLLVAVRRTSPAAAPAAAAAAPTPVPRPRGREATVRTVLHPQGYVEIDGSLYRAEWAEPHGSPPAPGERVEVVEGDAGVLLAYAPERASRRGGAI
ncbi:hypothetical protein [Streptomyces sp. 6N223]|uniref:hypothetical protein n=1 Tax=Streptomyces sp. 6N223 TaxID=3457412 RepID=UPI003FD27AF1